VRVKIITGFDSPENQQARDVLRITPCRVAACVRDVGLIGTRVDIEARLLVPGDVVLIEEASGSARTPA
jgi:hypothetical protein